MTETSSAAIPAGSTGGGSTDDGPDHEIISAGAFAKPLTGFRGLGAIIVVVGHTFFATRLIPYNGAIHFLSVIVPIFFVVSAYALYRPFIVAQLDHDEQPSAKAFWWRRFLRIYPLYFVALTLYLIILPGVRPQSGRVIDYLKLYGFMQIYDPDLVTFSGIPAAWFLCDEVVFYLMIPGIALGASWLNRRLAGPKRARRPAEILRSHTLIAIAMIVIGQCSRTYLLIIDYPGATSLPVSNMDYYGFGILLGVWSLRERHGLAMPRPVDWLRRRWVLALAVVLSAVGLMRLVANSPFTNTSHWEDVQRYAVYTWMVVPLMIVMCLGFQDRGFNRWFSSARWGFLALLSLHIYLWHQLVLGAIDRYAFRVNAVEFGPRFTTGLVMCAAAVGITIAWSALLRPGLDSPYKRWSKLIPRPAQLGPYPGWLRPASLGLVGILLVVGVAVSIEYGGSPIKVRGGVGLITVTNAEPGDSIIVEGLEGRRGDAIQQAAAKAEPAEVQADEWGTAIIRDLEPGRYQVRQERGDRLIVARKATVTAVDDHPSQAFYDGKGLEPGLNEIVTRDGTRLSAYVKLPGPVSEGPYPTVVELTGYQIADARVTQPASAVARALGYATVGVNVRGTGCSAGAFELLSDTQAADGYDVVETVAAQSWAKGGTVGLIGFSYGGLGALEAAATAPPHLNRVSALSVYGDARAAFHPGGIANSGFPVGWMQDLMADSKPSGAPWIQQRIAKGDTACGRNQLLHGHEVELVERYLGNDVALDDRFDQLSPLQWAAGVEVPVFLSGQLQDATIGTDAADLFNAFTAAPVKKMVLTNGTHGDAVAPQILRRMDQFLSLYAADEVPEEFDPAAILRKTRPGMDPTRVPIGPEPPVTFDQDMTLYEARTAYEAAPDVEILFESGNTDRAEAAAATTSRTFETWPPTAGGPTPLYLAPGGALANAPAATAPSATFTTDPAVSGQAYNIEGSDLTKNTMSGWTQPDPSTSASWVSDTLPDDTMLVGDTTLDLWVRFDAADADLQATLSEIAPDGHETMIQVGWRRASNAEGDPEPGTWFQVPIRLGPVGHIVREGSRLRVLVGTPGTGQVQWSFYPPDTGAAQVSVGQGGDYASVLQLPSLGAVEVASEPPACGVLRGQPCRPYEPLENQEAAL